VNLREFMARAPTSGMFLPRAMYLKEPGWKGLYVRHTQRILAGQKRECIDLASMVAAKPGNGLFKALVQRIRTEYPMLPIYIESVMTERFCEGLRRMGFEPERPGEVDLPLSFYLLPTSRVG
jgi:hypothetical protein